MFVHEECDDDDETLRLFGMIRDGIRPDLITLTRGEQISVSIEITNETEGIRLLWVGFSVLDDKSFDDFGYFGLVGRLSVKIISNRTDRKID